MVVTKTLFAQEVQPGEHFAHIGGQLEAQLVQEQDERLRLESLILEPDPRN